MALSRRRISDSHLSLIDRVCTSRTGACCLVDLRCVEHVKYTFWMHERPLCPLLPEARQQSGHQHRIALRCGVKAKIEDCVPCWPRQLAVLRILRLSGGDRVVEHWMDEVEEKEQTTTPATGASLIIYLPSGVTDAIDSLLTVSCCISCGLHCILTDS